MASVIALYEAECQKSRTIVAAFDGPDALVPYSDDQISVRSVIVHMLEETARHVGHMDIIREQIDGGTGWGRPAPSSATVRVTPNRYVADMRNDSYAIGWRVLLTGLILIVMVLPSSGIMFGILGALLVIWGGNAVLASRRGRRARYR